MCQYKSTQETPGKTTPAAGTIENSTIIDSNANTSIVAKDNADADNVTDDNNTAADGNGTGRALEPTEKGKGTAAVVVAVVLVLLILIVFWLRYRKIHMPEDSDEHIVGNKAFENPQYADALQGGSSSTGGGPAAASAANAQLYAVPMVTDDYADMSYEPADTASANNTQLYAIPMAAAKGDGRGDTGADAINLPRGAVGTVVIEAVSGAYEVVATTNGIYASSGAASTSIYNAGVPPPARNRRNRAGAARGGSMPSPGAASSSQAASPSSSSSSSPISPLTSAAATAATAATYATVVETGDVVYNAGDGGGDGEISTAANNSSSLQQQVAVVYSDPHANRNAGSGISSAVEAGYAGYEPPGSSSSSGSGGHAVGGGAGAAPEIVYAVPLEGDGRRVVPRVPNVIYQPADGPSTDNRVLVRLPNVIYEPAANNTYDAGVSSNNRASNV